MIRLLEAKSYRCLRYLRQRMTGFHILVGPNASGKTTFLDVVAFIGDLLRDGLDRAVETRSPSLSNLVWMEQGTRFELALELDIPARYRSHLAPGGRARYEVAVGTDAKGELALLGETLWLKPEPPPEFRETTLFPSPPSPPESLILPPGGRAPRGWKKVVSKRPESGNDYFASETTGWNNLFRLGPRKPALANLPEDEERFPVAIWVKRFLIEGVRRLTLNSEAMRRPSPPGRPLGFQPDGSNLPWVIDALLTGSPEVFQRWIRHVRTALPDVCSIDTVEREEDRYRYLRVVYGTGLKAPSWTVSDGTLRLLALTLIAYLSEPERVYLIEEPENGIHPKAVETVFQSLASAYDTQMLCASHSPVILSLAAPLQLLCFARTPDGATDVVRGDEHPLLSDWTQSTDLGTLFAMGVLG